MSKQKEALKETIDKYHQLSNQTAVHSSGTGHTEDEHLFDLSQTIDQRSMISDLQHDSEFPETEDSVLVKLQQEKQHILR